MKRVLVVGQSDNPGGVEAVIKRYYEAVKQEIQFDLIVSTQVCYDEDYYRKITAKSILYRMHSLSTH